MTKVFIVIECIGDKWENDTSIYGVYTSETKAQAVVETLISNRDDEYENYWVESYEVEE